MIEYEQLPIITVCMYKNMIYCNCSTSGTIQFSRIYIFSDFTDQALSKDLYFKSKKKLTVKFKFSIMMFNVKYSQYDVNIWNI